MVLGFIYQRYRFCRNMEKMTASKPSQSNDLSPTSITDLYTDTLVHCANYLNLQDISNLAMSCKYLNQVAYSDSIWQNLFRKQWPDQHISGSILGKSNLRVMHMDRHTAIRKFKFDDPHIAELDTDQKPCNLIYLGKNGLVFSQGPLIQMGRIDSCLYGGGSMLTLSDHKARISCMRCFPISETSLFRSETQQNEKALVTASCDHSIRLWWKGRCQRCFRGHNGPVNTLSDKLIGDGSVKLFGSGGEDCTVRLWSLSSTGKRGQHALRATLYGHEKPVVLMSVAGHKSSLLVSMSRDSKVRVWDTTASCSSSCVGKTAIPGSAVALKPDNSLVYLASNSCVTAVDLRTMKNTFCTKIHPKTLNSFEILPSKSLFCTGETGKTTLWDIRRASDSLEPEPVTVLQGRNSPITRLYMDRYKIVTAGMHDTSVDVWDTDTGGLTTSFPTPYGCSAMAVDGCRIVTASFYEENIGSLCIRDFSNSNCQILSDESGSTSKFWNDPLCDSDESDSPDIVE